MTRGKCFRCFRPQNSCMCAHVNPIKTRTRFVILMHPKEFKKTKNNTGRLTHLSLPNSEIHMGIDFSDHPRVNELIDSSEHACYVLYPGPNSIRLNTTAIGSAAKESVIFIIDATWACSKKMLRLSRNLQQLPKVSFESERTSQYRIKQQPNLHCLSTIESTQFVLELLNEHRTETIGTNELEHFLEPFKEMVEYQIGCTEKCHGTADGEKPGVRFKATRGRR